MFRKRLQTRSDRRRTGVEKIRGQSETHQPWIPNHLSTYEDLTQEQAEAAVARCEAAIAAAKAGAVPIQEGWYYFRSDRFYERRSKAIFRFEFG